MCGGGKDHVLLSLGGTVAAAGMGSGKARSGLFQLSASP